MIKNTSQEVLVINPTFIEFLSPLPLPTPLVSPRIELIKLNGIMHFVSLFLFCFNYIVCVTFSQGDLWIYD